MWGISSHHTNVVAWGAASRPPTVVLQFRQLLSLIWAAVCTASPNALVVGVWGEQASVPEWKGDREFALPKTKLVYLG
jgi:hypothetical protein